MPSFDDVINLYTSAKAKYRKKGVWMMNDKTALALRKLKDADGNYIWNHNTDTILGRPVYISEFMPDAEVGKKPIAFGDLSFYWIINRSNTLNIDHQLQRISDMRYIIETTKTAAGTRRIPITDDVADMFRAIIEDREPPKVEKVIDGYTGFLFYDEDDMPLVAMHWQHRFNHMVGRYNDIYKVQMPNITPHVCRHTYCSNQAKAGMNPKTLQYPMGHQIFR